MLEGNTKFLTNLPKDEVKSWLGSIDTVLSDCDGVLWHDDVAIPGAPETINALKSAGKRIYFVTNNSLKTRQEIWQRANTLGFNVDVEDILAPNHIIAEYLKDLQFDKKAYIIGHPAISKELASYGIESFGPGPDPLRGTLTEYIKEEIQTQNVNEVGAVIVGFDEYFTFPKMIKASNFITSSPNCLFLSTNSDIVHVYPEYRIPGTGTLLTAIETTVGRSALVLGKPSPSVCDRLIKSGKMVPERTLMIGDCCKVDVPFGKNCGVQTLLVGTGATRYETIKKMLEDPVKNQQNLPDFCTPKLRDLLQYI